MAPTTEMQSSGARAPNEPAAVSIPFDDNQYILANGDIENQIKLEANNAEIDSSHTMVKIEQDPPEDKDFPDLAPSKSLDFPDGTLFILPTMLMLIKGGKRHG